MVNPLERSRAAPEDAAELLYPYLWWDNGYLQEYLISCSTCCIRRHPMRSPHTILLSHDRYPTFIMPFISTPSMSSFMNSFRHVIVASSLPMGTKIWSWKNPLTGSTLIPFSASLIAMTAMTPTTSREECIRM
ncbi:hypothetical protein N7G274_002981 [Stereocaulon virgatum]|uniref:Uncharacterized protein n=1 Tax=Stereocaulon virgatum TaxID=373712 RepID=A0ABR4AFI6_9LECA